MAKSDLNKFSKLFAELKNEINSFSENDINNFKEHLTRKITEIDQIIRADKSSVEDIKKDLSVKTLAEYNGFQLNSQLEFTNDKIWSVDADFNILTVNSNFRHDFKLAFGVDLIPGINVLSSLPEQLKTLWKQRYLKALNGEKFSITDRFDFEDVPQFIETSFYPIANENKIFGVSCFSHDVTKQKESEDKFKVLSDISPSAISIQSNDNILYVNKTWENLTGYSWDDKQLIKFSSIIHPESIEIVNLHLIQNQFKNTDARRANIKIITKSQKKRWIDLSIVDVKYDGRPATLAVANDITEIYHLQEHLKRNRANLISQIENTDARIWSIDKEYKIITTNSNFKNDYKIAFNIELEEGSYAMANLPKELESIWTSRYERALTGDHFTIIDEFKIEAIPQFAETSFNPIWLDKKIVGVSCFSRDISKQKNYENALTESELKYKTLVSNIPSITYRCLLDSDWTMEFISDEVERLVGYPPADFIKNYKRTFASIIYHEDRQLVEQTILKSISQNKKYEIEYRLQHANGSIRWVFEIGRAQYNRDNKVEWLDGIISDITHQKKAERALKESEEKYRTIFNSINDIYIRTDMEGNVQLVSPSAFESFGYRPEEIIGRNIYSFYKDTQAREMLFGRLIEYGSVKDYEAVYLSKDGKEKVVSINAKLLKDEFDKPIGIEGVARDVTLRKIAEQSLQERTKELNSIFDNAPVILMLIDSSGRVININRAATRFSAQTKKGYLDLLVGEILNCIYALKNPGGCGKGEDCSNCGIRNSLNRTLSSKENQYQVEGSILIKSGILQQERHFLISTTYIDFENDIRVLISLDDITEIKEAQEQIRKLSTAVNQSNATIVITDIDGNIQYANPQFEKTTGYSLTEAIGKNPRILKSDNTTPSDYKNLWTTILGGKTWQGEFLNVRRDKTEYWESANISPIINDSGKITSFIAVKEDITERKRIQQELIKSEQELRQANEEKSRFFSILAHDLRGMVGSYHAYSDLLRTHFNNFTETELKEQLENLTKSSRDSLTLLDNLLDWARASLGKVSLSPTNLSLNGEIENVIDILRDIAKAKLIVLTNNSEKDYSLFADSHVLQTVIRNLVNNAIKFTPESGRISIYSNQISPVMLEISVKDTGIGMDTSTLAKLFKPGEFVTMEGTNNEKGTGLGLMICDELVKKLGGKIFVESEPGKGSRFYFQIPVK